MKNLGFIFWLILSTIFIRILGLNWNSLSPGEALFYNICQYNSFFHIVRDSVYYHFGIFSFIIGKTWVLVFGKSIASFQLLSLVNSVLFVYSFYVLATNLLTGFYSKVYAYFLVFTPSIIVFSTKLTSLDYTCILSIICTLYAFKIISQDISKNLLLKYFVSVFSIVFLGKFGWLFILAQFLAITALRLLKNIDNKKYLKVVKAVALPVIFGLIIEFNSINNTLCLLYPISKDKAGLVLSTLFGYGLCENINIWVALIIFLSIISLTTVSNLLKRMPSEKLKGIFIDSSENFANLAVMLYFLQFQVVSLVLLLFIFGYYNDLSHTLTILPYLLILLFCFLAMVLSKINFRQLIILPLFFFMLAWSGDYLKIHDLPLSSLFSASEQIKYYINTKKDVVVLDNPAGNLIIASCFKNVNNISTGNIYNLSGLSINSGTDNFFKALKNSSNKSSPLLEKKIQTALSQNAYVWFIDYKIKALVLKSDKTLEAKSNSALELLDKSAHIFPLSRTNPCIYVDGLMDESKIYCYHK